MKLNSIISDNKDTHFYFQLILFSLRFLRNIIYLHNIVAVSKNSIGFTVDLW